MALSNKKKKIKRKHTCHYGPTNTYVISSPFGEILFTCCQFGLHCLQFKARNFSNFPNYKIPITVLDQMWCDNGYVYKPARMTIEWLRIYFTCPKLIQSVTPPPICKIMKFGKESFRGKVLLALEKVSFGSTITYNRLVGTIGQFLPHAALKSVIESCPMELIVPYHRIITVDRMHNLGLHSDISRQLLFHEAVHQR